MTRMARMRNADATDRATVTVKAPQPFLDFILLSVSSVLSVVASLIPDTLSTPGSSLGLSDPAQVTSTWGRGCSPLLRTCKP